MTANTKAATCRAAALRPRRSSHVEDLKLSIILIALALACVHSSGPPVNRRNRGARIEGTANHAPRQRVLIARAWTVTRTAEWPWYSNSRPLRGRHDNVNHVPVTEFFRLGEASNAKSGGMLSVIARSAGRPRPMPSYN